MPMMIIGIKRLADRRKDFSTDEVVTPIRDLFMRIWYIESLCTFFPFICNNKCEAQFWDKKWFCSRVQGDFNSRYEIVCCCHGNWRLFSTLTYFFCLVNQPLITQVGKEVKHILMIQLLYLFIFEIRIKIFNSLSYCFSFQFHIFYNATLWKLILYKLFTILIQLDSNDCYLEYSVCQIIFNIARSPKHFTFVNFLKVL